MKAEQLTDEIEEAKTPKDELFEVKVTDKYTIADPTDIDFDTRYVLYGDAACAGVTSVPAKDSNGVETKVECLYEILYLKDGQAVAEYKYYLSRSEEGAQALQNAFGKTDCVKGRVFCMATTKAEEVQSMISMLYKFSGELADESPQSYLNYLVSKEKYRFFKNVGQKEDPEPESILKGTSMADTFGVKMSGSCTFTDAKYFAQDYDKRYVLYGDKECAPAKQLGAEGFYEILYDKDGKAAGEYKAYVMGSPEQAEQTRQQMSEAFGEDSVLCKGNVVLLFSTGDYVQQTIDLYEQSGILSKGTVIVYAETWFVNQCKMAEILEAPGSNLEPEKEPAFDIMMTESFTFKDSENFTQEYHGRYVLCDDGAMANMYGAKKLYEIIYEKENQVIGEYLCCIMENAAGAEGFASMAPSMGISAENVKVRDNVVLLFTPAGSVPMSAEEYVAFWEQNGAVQIKSEDEVITEAGSKESALDITSAMQMKQLAREMGIEPNAARLESGGSLAAAAREAGIESGQNLWKEESGQEEGSDLEESEEVEAASQTPGTEGETFDPSEAGNVWTPEKVPEETEGGQPEEDMSAEAGNVQPVENGTETFDPSEAGNSLIPEAAPEVSEEEENFDPSFAGNVEAPETSAEPEKNPADILITADYTFKDPEGFEYDTRYVFHGDGTSELAKMLAADRNGAVSDVYLIFYEKAGKLTAEYRCFVLDGAAVCEETKPEDLADLLGSLPGMEKAYEASTKGYVDFIRDVYRLEEVKEGDR